MQKIELEASTLSTFAADLGFASVYGLEISEVPQPPPTPVGILNVTGWCKFPDILRAGLCVMVVGRDAAGEILWSCCLMAQTRGTEPQHMLESLLVAPEVLGRTEHIAIRIYGGRFG